MAARVQTQGAHLWMVRSSFFDKYTMGAKGVDDLRHQGQIPFFQLCRGKKDKSGQGDVKLGP